MIRQIAAGGVLGGVCGFTAAYGLNRSLTVGQLAIVLAVGFLLFVRGISKRTA